MNDTLFNFFFSLASNNTIAMVALFISNKLIYILFAVIIIFVAYKMRPLFLNICILGGASVSAWVASKIVKTIFKIPRPFVTMHLTPLFNETGFSLPSTHATIFAALTVVAYAMNRTLGIVFFICTLCIGVSRIILGVHYPFDVLLGFVIGALIGLLFVRVGKSPRVVAFLGQSL